MGQSPLVSIGIASYNNAGYIKETLNSVVRQSYGNIEIIIVDDASTDYSVEVIQQWIAETGQAVLLKVNQKNLGVAATGNQMLAMASGKYFKFFGSDDVMLPHHISDLVQLFENFEKENLLVAFVSTPVIQIDDQGAIIYEPETQDGNNVVLYRQGYEQILLRQLVIQAPGVVVRTSALKEVGYNTKYIIEDFPLWLQLSKKYPYCVYEVPSICYRIHSGSMMGSKKAQITRVQIQILLEELEIVQDAGLAKRLMGRIRDMCFSLYGLDRAASRYSIKVLNQKRFSFKTSFYQVLMQLHLLPLLKKPLAG